MLIIKMSLQKLDEDNMNPSHSETTQQSLEMKKERVTRNKRASGYRCGKLLIPNVHMDAIYIRSLFSEQAPSVDRSQPVSFRDKPRAFEKPIIM